MAEAIVGPLLSKLQEVVVAEANTLASVGGSVDSLRDKLMWLHALLHEIEQRRHDTSRFRHVLACQIREVASQAEDAVDEFHLRAGRSRRGWRWILYWVTIIRARWTLYPEVQSMNARLEEIIENSGKYGKDYDGSSGDEKGWKQSAIRREWIWENSVPFEMMGRTEHKENLKKKLMDQSGPAVIYVVGDSGIGKRTLLQYAYEDIDIRAHFEVCFSVNLQASINMVQEIKNQLKTYDCLEDEIRFLVWINSPVSIKESENKELESLSMFMGRKIKFMVSAKSSREWMKNSIIKLEPLDYNESLKLFQYAVGHWEGTISGHIKTGIDGVEKDIRSITNGLPLAVVTLAKFMIAMDNYNKWDIASNYTMSNINDDKVKVMLHLSIDDLPDDLKLCLLYTAGFPENTTIDAKQLLRLWMAEGFLSPQLGMEAEQLGQCYLKELIHRGLLLNKTSPHCDEVRFVAVHDRFHPIFRSEGQRRSFIHVHCGGFVVAAPDNTRRLALQLQSNKNKSLHLGDCYGKLRTVVSFCHHHPDTTKNRGTDSRPNMVTCSASFCATCSASMPAPCGCCAAPNGVAWNAGTGQSRNDGPTKLEGGMRPLLTGSPYLRVIHLEGIDIGTEVPEEIGDMVQLRYLGLRCPSLKRIPSSIGKLERLQTLDVRDTGVTKLPRSFWKIRTLLHVLGDGLVFPSKKIKEKMADHLRLEKKKGKSADMDSLHTLETVTIRHMNHRWTGRLRLLRRLRVVGLQGSEDQSDLETILRALSCLQSLCLSGHAIPIEWLFASHYPCLVEHVMSLELHGTLWRHQGQPILGINNLSGYNICLLNLTRLVLRSTLIDQTFIDVIAKLPGLAELELLQNSFVGPMLVFCAAKGFRSLEALQISGLLTLKKICGPDSRPFKPTFIDMPHAIYITHQSCSSCRSSSADKTNVQGSSETVQAGTNTDSSIQQGAGTGTDSSIQQGAGTSAPDSTIQQKNVLHEMIMEAIDQGNSTKTAIGNFIASNYGDPLVKILEHMVECHDIKSERQKNFTKYYLVEPTKQSPTRTYHKDIQDVVDTIREVIDKNGSSKSAIHTNFRNRRHDIPLFFVLKHMDDLLKEEKNGTTKYVRKSGATDRPSAA